MGAVLQTCRKKKPVQHQVELQTKNKQQKNIKARQHYDPALAPDLQSIVQNMENNEEESSFNSPTETVINSVYHVNRKAGHDRIFIAAIDIGTTYSGYAYASRRDLEKDPSNIYCPQWRGDEGMYYKTATAVLFDEDGNFHKFGFEAEEYYNDDQSDKFKCFFFKNFKMLLYENRNDLSEDVVIKDITGKQMKAIQVFSAAICYLKDHLLKTLQKSFHTDSNISNTDIHWVLTVPAIWEMRAKQFMRDAAEMAGILGDQLSLALEPEAASLYCRKVPMRIKDSVTKTVDLLGPGISYVLLDQGGGTLDVTGHRIEKDNCLTEIISPNGGNWGGNNVNYEFEKYLNKMFTKTVVEKIKAEDPVAYFDIIKQFERKKKSVNPKSEGDVVLSISPVFSEMYDKIYNASLPSEIQIKRGKMRISAQQFKSFFDPSIKSITQHVLEIFKNPKLQNVNVILAVGGFSESEIIIDSISKSLPNMETIVPKDPVLAVLKGAVVFGFEPCGVKSRISRYTYGIKVEKEIRTKGDENYRKIRRNVQKRRFAIDVFERLVEIGEEINVGTWQSTMEYEPINKNDKEVQIEFYATEEKDPVHVTDPGCMKLGTLKVNLRERKTSDGALKLQINAGGTEILAVITDENNGQIFKAKFCLP
ncbi:heat shock 70 kDa protein 12A-like [Mytilus edulis]|uniref:heat shock 70 kDa protein 12A-like n=1 Tax=Mytilus edulis TaxID=6550 RepID=UPI0039EE03CC